MKVAQSARILRLLWESGLEDTVQVLLLQNPKIRTPNHHGMSLHVVCACIAYPLSVLKPIIVPLVPFVPLNTRILPGCAHRL
jgi:hypothetical protein